MKATAAQIGAALDRASPDVRLYLLHGPDVSGALALSARLEKALGAEAERIDIEPASLKGDPALLSDEAASIGLFGGRRMVRVTNAGEEIGDAVEALLAATTAGNPVVVVAPAVKASGRLVKLGLGAAGAMTFACYVPEAEKADALASSLAREHGLRLAPGVAARIARAGEGDRAVIAMEIAKLALFLDADADRPGAVDDAVLDAVGAGSGEGEIGGLVAAVVAREPAALETILRSFSGADASPIPWLRALARRFAQLAEMRMAVDAGTPIADAMKRHQIFWKDQPATASAVARWTAARAMAAHDAVRRAERAAMARSAAARIIAEQQLVSLARR